MQKTFNEKLNERGTANFASQRCVNKEGKIVRGMIFIPITKVKDVNQAKGWNLPTDHNLKLFIRGSNPTAIVLYDDEANVIEGWIADSSQQTARGKRYHEKLREAIDDLVGKSLPWKVDSNLIPAPDAFKTTSELTCDDLLEML